MKLEINSAFVEDHIIRQLAANNIFITPPIGGDNYWLFRVQLSKNNSIIGFPKFGTIGIGFENEIDWNTNLPYQLDTEEIYNHIKRNGLKYKKKRVIKAIQMIQQFIKENLK